MRVVLKVGSSSLTTPDGHLDPDRIGTVVDAVVAVRARGDEVVLVSSGAIAAGLGPLALPNRPRDLPTQQAAAAVGQRALIAHYSEAFAAAGLIVGQVLLTVEDVTRRSHYRNARQTFAKLLELGVVPVVNENDTVATSEIRFGDNDRLAALVAHLVHADELILLSDVDGLYTAHPDLPGSRPIATVSSDADLEGIDVARVGSAVGTGGMVTKIEAARIATAAGIPVRLTSAARAIEAVEGQPVGTRFNPTGKRRATRLLWLAHASETRGRLLLDDGARRALVERGASLLAAGIVAVEGEFSAADPVDVIGPDGALVARGIVNYDSQELPEMLGRSTSELAATMGADHDRAVIHRDDLVLMS
ncbi:glutamate 5-kinase [Aeromicrobium sp. 636]|uniref:Glutamate 5-kinase n=1 Tax=Aeromicrobium senzhongii TaxID=2663859 RepID=A0A8I0EU99_9ACTN|nr:MULTISPECIES: glutamate 5-kinase [Aeromicrobium]MBC9225738.1 glutamate 5-kinase [Aeromicrobium senzhongii]MCQ3997847.1 glutamate 5-kinase [Aeromicrobium sp. 636]MTB87775.1 glutamate 5-kinase [Aeromicrobium senzhongii]QNL95200.1 glutamate 5-kinase [Aeromicrobium senzhongii]